MNYTFEQINNAEERLKLRFKEISKKSHITKDPVFKELYTQIKNVPEKDRPKFGAEVNLLKKQVSSWLDESDEEENIDKSIDITAPWDVNIPSADRPKLLPTEDGTVHPLTSEINKIVQIFNRMGFESVESRQIDDDFNMFEALNFPKGHPARDDWDTFMTEEGLIAPAHTSTMQNRLLKQKKENLNNAQPIAMVIPGRVFRNEDLDRTHEHTFYQFEGIYVNEGVNTGNLIATLKAFLSEYFEQELNVKIQPFYFPFTEPSFEFAVQRPESLRKDNSEAEQWLELGGCGMIHPNVLKMADIDPVKYSGFAWGFGIERMVLLKYGIDDIRYFESGKLEFLRQFR